MLYGAQHNTACIVVFVYYAAAWADEQVHPPWNIIAMVWCFAMYNTVAVNCSFFAALPWAIGGNATMPTAPQR